MSISMHAKGVLSSWEMNSTLFLCESWTPCSSSMLDWSGKADNMPDYEISILAYYCWEFVAAAFLKGGITYLGLGLVAGATWLSERSLKRLVTHLMFMAYTWSLPFICTLCEPIRKYSGELPPFSMLPLCCLSMYRTRWFLLFVYYWDVSTPFAERASYSI